MMHDSPYLKPEAAAAAQRQLEAFAASTPSIALAVLTSSDGFELAAYPAQLPVAQRIAAMSSSLQALSEALAREASLSNSRDLIIESDDGTILVLGLANTAPRMSLAVVATNKENLGHLLWASRNCCKSLESDLQA
jgi:predicted regulator of Ras-like GTPase activity (Roadblock/LC7/MglB family)